MWRRFDSPSRSETHPQAQPPGKVKPQVKGLGQVEPQVLVQGWARKTWETAAASGNGKLIVVEGRWPLPARGQ
jgi:hypothetical protein